MQLDGPRNLLITCGGKWVGHVLQLLDAMRQIPALAAGRVLVADRATNTPAGHFAHASFVVPPIDHPDYIDSLLELCQRETIGVVVPLIDIDLVRLAPHHQRFAAVGACLVAPRADVAEMCFDKRQFDRFARTAGIAVPRRIANDSIDRAEYPLFCKPARGFGSIGSGVCHTPAAAREMLGRNPSLVFEQYVAGPEVSVDGYVSISGRQLIRVQRLREQVVGGEAYRSRTVRLEEVDRLAEQTLAALSARGFRGPANVQIIAAGDPVVIDVNPRLGSASVLSNMATGGRLFRTLLSEATGTPCDGEPGDYQEGLHLYRFLGDLFYDEQRPVAAFPRRSAA